MQQQQLDLQLEYRLATLADKAQVAVCHGGPPGSIYYGIDYAEQRYDAALNSWNKVCGLCYDRSAGIVVGYGQIFVFDNKRHMLLTALRVHIQYQGRGIAGTLRNFLCREARNRFPDVDSEVRFGVYKHEFSDPDFYARNPDYEIISKRHYFVTEFPLSNLPQLRQSMSAAVATAESLNPSSSLTSWTNRRSLYSAMLSDPDFRKLHDGLAISIDFEVLELMEENLEILPGDRDDNAPCAMVVRGNEVTLGFGCLLYCARGLRADLDLYNNAIDSADFSPHSLAGTATAIVLGFLDRTLTSESSRLSQIPAKSLSLFVSLDCFNRRGFGCPNCDLEARLAARLRDLIGGDMASHPFYSEGCPYPLIRRRLLF